MAEFGWLTLRCVSASIQPDMDYCARLSSSGATSKTHPHSGQSSTGPRASSCLSSTMVGHTDPDDSGSSRPPTPTRTTAESNHSVTRDSPLLRHELELSISSLNDAQRSSSGDATAGAPLATRLTSVKDEFDPTSTSLTRKDITGRAGAGGRSVGVEDETSFFGPPRKRARMSPLGFRVEEGSAGKVREELQRHPSLTVSLSVSSDVTGPPHTLVPSRSLPSFRLADNDPSLSRGASGPGSSNATMSWWLGTGAKVSNPNEGLQYQAGPGSARANFGIDGRGLIPGTTLQERDFLCKQTSFFPNVLGAVETSDHLRRGSSLGVEYLPIATSVGARASGSGQDQKLQGGRSQYFLNDPFFHQRTETSTSRTSNISTVSEETVPRSGNPVFSGGKITETFRESLPTQEASNVYGQQMNERLFETGKRRNPVVAESQLGFHERDAAPLHGFPRAHQQPEQRTTLGSPGGNANTTFYARIRDAAQQPTSSNSFPSQAAAAAGFPGAFNVNSGLGFNLGVQSTARASSAQMGTGGPVHFIGEPLSSNAVTQVGGSDILRNLGGNPGMGPISPFSTQVQNPEHIRPRNSQDFLQTLQQQQKQPFSSEVGERYRLSPSSGQVGRGPGAGPGHQDFSFLSSHPSQQTISVELNPPPRGNVSVQTSTGLRDFLSPPAPKGVDLSYGGGSGRSPRVGSQTFSSVPTQLSLQAPAAPGLLVLMEGRSIGRRIGIQDYDGYDSFAAAMRTMFISQISQQDSRALGEISTLTNAIPGYVIAYEDEEGDILLAGDLPWREFVRVAKQIRIVSTSRISFKPPAGPSRS